uniref:Uncharacterized protein n=1 Tax=Anguilla anguilla TaxID=7936 RepID=A0A0E9PP96_ANGAN
MGDVADCQWSVNYLNELFIIVSLILNFYFKSEVIKK